MIKNFIDELRYRGSPTKAQDLENTQGKEFQVRREGNERSHQDASLGDWQDCREKYFTGGEGTSLGKKMTNNILLLFWDILTSQTLVWDVLSFNIIQREAQSWKSHKMGQTNNSSRLVPDNGTTMSLGKHGDCP